MRSDYMLDDKRSTQTNGFHATPKSTQRDFEMIQVEVNMIAASFGCLGSLVGKLHRYACIATYCLNCGMVARKFFFSVFLKYLIRDKVLQSELADAFINASHRTRKYVQCRFEYLPR